MTDAHDADTADRAVADLIRAAVARRRMSRQQVADDARISLSTLEKGLSGERPFTLTTLVRLEDALGIALRSAQGQGGMQSSVDLGGYRRDAVDWLTGLYLTLRPSFERADAIYAYLTEIAWNEDRGHLAFRERGRLDAAFAQRGAVSMPYQSGHIYLVTNERGQFRLATLQRPSIEGNMYGLLSTLRVERGSRLTPTACSIALVRCADVAHDASGLGQILPEQPVFQRYRDELDRVREEQFAALIE
jgi:transcriptional regulator with XRE-family HTH domain